MKWSTQFFIGCSGAIAAFGLAYIPNAMAQLYAGNPSNTLAQRTDPRTGNNFQGRGIAQGSAFAKGRNANTALTLEGDVFGFELVETGSRASGRVQYRGSIIRRTTTPGANSFTLDGRVQSFVSSDNLRVRGTTTGTCRIEVFDARVISSTCNTVTANSRTQFLGLEQF